MTTPKKPKPLTPRQLALVQAKLSGLKNLDAGAAAGYSTAGAPTTRRNAVSRELAKPHVRLHLIDEINARFPDLNKDVAELLNTYVKRAKAGELSAKDAMSVMDRAVKYTGQEPAKETHVKRMTVNATLPLPGDSAEPIEVEHEELPPEPEE